MVGAAKMVARPRTRCQYAQLGHRGKLRNRWQPRSDPCRGQSKCAGVERGRQANRCRSVGCERRESRTDRGQRSAKLVRPCSGCPRQLPSAATRTTNCRIEWLSRGSWQMRAYQRFSSILGFGATTVSLTSVRIFKARAIGNPSSPSTLAPSCRLTCSSTESNVGLRRCGCWSGHAK